MKKQQGKLFVTDLSAFRTDEEKVKKGIQPPALINTLGK